MFDGHLPHHPWPYATMLARQLEHINKTNDTLLALAIMLLQAVLPARDTITASRLERAARYQL